MKKLSFVLGLLFLASGAYAQVMDSQEGTQRDTTSITTLDPIRRPVDGIYEKVHLSKFQPITLTHVREADVMWAELLWLYIDLTEKINHPLYYPTSPKGNWKSLIQALLDAVGDTLTESEPLRLYNDEHCSTPYSISGVLASLGKNEIIENQNEWGEVISQSSVFVPYSPSEVYRYEVYEQAFIDRQRSVMEQRIMSICPYYYILSDAATAYEENSGDDEMVELSPRSWRRMGYFYYPEVRPLLATTEVFNPGNNAQRRTFDDIFLMRRFQSYVSAKENVHDNRAIREYIVNGMDQRLASDAIVDKIRVREHELWEF